MYEKNNEPAILLVCGIILLCLSAIHPYDYTTWWLETLPIFVAVPILVATHKRHPLTPLLYRLLFAHALILMLGGHYTYAEVPLGYWMQDWFEFTRNNYDKIGHFAQALCRPCCSANYCCAIRRCARKVALHTGCRELPRVSASYELIEWAAAVALGQGADAFLGTQGDIWDTQSDMLMALIGALSAQVLLANIQDKQLVKR